MFYNIIIFILLHVIGDFYLQSDQLSKCKQAQIDDKCKDCESCKQKSYFNIFKIILHVILYLIPFAVLFLLWEGNLWKILIIFSILFISHIIIDCFTSWLKTKIKKIVSFIIDQSLHIIIIVFIVYLLMRSNILNFKYFETVFSLLIILLILKPTAIIINNIYYDLFDSPVNSTFDTGIMIGMFERIIVVTLCYLGAVSAIAIIIAAKTWVRYGEIKENNDFRNKYLIGTLASIGLALVFSVIYQYVMKNYNLNIEVAI